MKQARNRFQDDHDGHVHDYHGSANYCNDYGHSQDNNYVDNDAPGETRQKVKFCRKHKFHFPRQEGGLGCS